ARASDAAAASTSCGCASRRPARCSRRRTRRSRTSRSPRDSPMRRISRGCSASTCARAPSNTRRRRDSGRPPTSPAGQPADDADIAMTWMNSVIDWVTPLALQVGLILFGFGVERLRPARPQGFSTLRLNLAYVAALRTIYAGLYPLSVALTTVLVNNLGGGFIELPKSGVALIWAIPVYALAMDGGEYAFHRAQHRIPWLWAMHSLHHSDPAVNVS